MGLYLIHVQEPVDAYMLKKKIFIEPIPPRIYLGNTPQIPLKHFGALMVNSLGVSPFRVVFRYLRMRRCGEPLSPKDPKMARMYLRCHF